MITKIQALASIRPGAKWSWAGDNYEDIEWLDQSQSKPTEKEVNDELVCLQEAEPAKIAKQNRLTAYQNESDPLFFKAQRGEATMDEWKSKIAEIKLRYLKT
jgi:hypothetical protein